MSLPEYLACAEATKEQIGLIPQHVHVSFDPTELSKTTVDQMQRWAGWSSLLYCMYQLKVSNLQALKPIFKVLTRTDLHRWSEGLSTGRYVNIKARNIGLRDEKTYQLEAPQTGIEFRCGYDWKLDPAILAATIRGERVWPELGPMPLPVADSSLSPSIKRAMLAKLGGDARWVLPLVPWEEHPLFTDIAGAIRAARADWQTVFDAHWSSFKFMGIQYADHVPFALLSNEWFTNALFDWAKASEIVPVLNELIYGA